MPTYDLITVAALDDIRADNDAVKGAAITDDWLRIKVDLVVVTSTTRTDGLVTSQAVAWPESGVTGTRTYTRTDGLVTQIDTSHSASGKTVRDVITRTGGLYSHTTRTIITTP